MDSSRPARRYSRDEMSRILELASEAPRSDVNGIEDSDGLTLAEIKEIAGQVGIDPARVERASAALRRSSAPRRRVSFGTYQLERQFGRSLSTEDMRFAAQEADRFFGVAGTLRESSNLVEWHSSEAGAFVGLVREADDTRARVIVDRSRQFLAGAGALSAGGLAVLANVAAAYSGALALLGSAGVLAATAGLVGAFWIWRRNRLLARIEHLLDLMTAGLAR